MRAATVPLLVSFLVTLLLTQATQSAPTQPVRWHPCAKIAQACTRAGFVPNGAKSGLGDHVGLYPSDHARDSNAAGHRLATNRSADLSGVQGARSELRKGRARGKDAVGHIKFWTVNQQPSCSAKTRRGGLRDRSEASGVNCFGKACRETGQNKYAMPTTKMLPAARKRISALIRANMGTSPVPRSPR
jgi:hypothetical protein